MVKNALSPMRAMEGLQDLVPADRLIGITSHRDRGASVTTRRAGRRSIAGARPL
jgi:hypothetical protein